MHMKPTLNVGFKTRSFSERNAPKGHQVFSVKVYATQLQLSTFLSLAHFFNYQIWSPEKQFERFPLVHTGFLDKTAVLSLDSPKSVWCHHSVTEAQNGWCWEGLWRSSCSPSLLKVTSTTPDFSGLNPFGVWISSGIEAPEPLWATYSSMWLFTQKRSVFLTLNRTYPTFQAVTTTSCPVTGHHWAVCVFHSSYQVL